MSADASSVSLPSVPLSRVLSSSLRAEFVCSSSARDLLHECCKEMVQLLASEANEMCVQEKKSRITPEHLCKALESLEYGHWLPAVSAVSSSHAAAASSLPRSRASSKRKLGASGKSLEELQAAQREKFEKAREKMKQMQQQQ